MKVVKVSIITLFILIPIGLVGLIFFAVAGPMSKPITTPELIGRYEAQLPEGGKEVLMLLPEGRCEQAIFFNNGQILKAIGKWQYDIVKTGTSSYDYLSLEGVRDSLSEFGNHINPNIAQDPKKINSGLPIERTLFGHIRIDLYEDQGIYYRKIEK